MPSFRFGGRFPRHHGGTITTLGRSRDTTGFPPGKKSPSIFTIPWTAVTSRNFLWVIFFFGGRPAVTHFIAFTKWPVVKSAQNYRLLVTWIQNSPTIIWLLFQQTARTGYRMTFVFIHSLFTPKSLKSFTRAEREQGMIEYSSLGGKSGGRIISERVIVKINGRFSD